MVVAILGLLVAFGSLQAQRNINDDQMQLNADLRMRERQRNAEKVSFTTVAQPSPDRSTGAVRVHNRSYSALTGVQIRAFAPIIQGPSSNPAENVRYRTWLAGTVGPCSVVTLEISDLPANIVRPNDSTNIDGPFPWIFLLSFFNAEGEWTIAADRLQPSTVDGIYSLLGVRDPNSGLEFLEVRERDQAEATGCA
ncbi:hypothetical protein ABZ777_22550 [Micromonospora parva]|uniref:hypothetical protein n=1 Tax=Micromonospora parva TaxID=1464048 RepID=UPI0033DC93A3